MSKFNEGDLVQFFPRRVGRVGMVRPSRLSEGVKYTVESTSNIGVRIEGVWYHEALFELAPKPVPNPESNKISENSVIQIGPEGLRIGTGELVSIRVPPTVDEIRARWNVDYNYDMNMANEAPRDIKTLLEHFDALQKAHDYQQSEAERYEYEARESAAENGRYIREKHVAEEKLQHVIDERNDALSRLSSVEDMILQWDSTADVSIEDMQAMLLEQVNGE